MNHQKALELLRKYSPTIEIFERIYRHSDRVRAHALELANRMIDVDLNFVETASLLHDIGRFKCPPGSGNGILHGVEGARILREENLPEHAEVAERHIGVGITRQDIIEQELPLPLKDFVPESKEQILVAHADNLDSKGVNSEGDVEERFYRDLGEEYRKRVQEFHRQIHRLIARAPDRSINAARES